MIPDYNYFPSYIVALLTTDEVVYCIIPLHFQAGFQCSSHSLSISLLNNPFFFPVFAGLRSSPSGEQKSEVKHNFCQ